jgi:hypothetical protein
MEDVCMTCANMCGVQLAIVDVSKFTKPLLYQFAWKIIMFIENKKKNNLAEQQQRLNCAFAHVFHK